MFENIFDRQIGKRMALQVRSVIGECVAVLAHPRKPDRFLAILRT